MGIDDRDYMRERVRARAGQTRWNDKRARVEAAWLDPRRSDRRSGSPATQNWLRALLWGLCAMLMLIPLHSDFQRKGWIPDLQTGEPFPETGSVTVARAINRRDITSRLTAITADANAIVQLFAPATNAHVLSVYVAANSRITIPAPSGTFRVRLVEGRKWFGTRRYFGPNTSYETVAELMTFEPRMGHIFDLNRRPDGNLKTRQMLSSPTPIGWTVVPSVTLYPEAPGKVSLMTVL